MENNLEKGVKNVKTVVSNGKKYHYHRTTGVRLPDLSRDHPDFIAAVRSVEDAQRIGTKSTAQLGLGEDVTNTNIADIAAPRTIDVIAYNVRQIVRFVYAAREGHAIYYHAGNLAGDAAHDPTVYEKQRYTQLMQQFGILNLRRAKVSENWHQYFAIRTDSPARHSPKFATAARITPDEYEALVAVLERQASISVSRAIRDHLGISDNAAAQMRTAMINNGWITNTRPPEVTDLGIALMA